VPGATTATLSFASVQGTDAGVYTLVATNPAGSVTSQPANLVVAVPAPVITAQPASQTVTAGGFTQFSVGASPAGVTFQWLRNGSAIAGATGPVLSFATVAPTDAASYAVVVTNSSGTVTSASASLTVTAAAAAPALTTQPANVTVAAGRGFRLAVAATGTGTLRFQWFRNGAPLAGATAATFSVGSAQPADAGSYHVVVSNATGSVTSRTATVVVAPEAPATPPVNSGGTPPPAAADSTPPAAAPASRLSNLSIRTSVAADQTVIVGLAVQGGARDVLVRAVGPGLAPFGVNGALADPRLEVFRGAALTLANDNWPAELAPGFARVGAFGLPLGSRDAALRQSVDGAVSIQARGSGTGILLLEAYDFGEGGSPRLVNVSARNRVGTGEEILVAGFTIAGTGPQRLLLRAVGPGLAGFGVADTLGDPVLALFAGAQQIAENDNWSADLAAAAARVGAFPLVPGSRDAALVVELPPGSYTAQVRGVGATTGEALVEIYELP
ncbi:MAG: hypothetical protein JNL92_07450, partial [Opitutaceae bacterium]|nr:hypothetical protein [Opitutaceae bacterium]